MEEMNDTDLKEAINNFMWMRCPGSWSLRKCERIACNIFDIFQEEKSTPDDK